MFRQTGNAPAAASKSGELLVTGSSGGATSDVNLTEVGGAPLALGQTTSAVSLPVVIASDQSPIPVTATFSPSGTQDVNLMQVAGAAVATGHGTAAGALRVELPTDGTGVVGLVAGSAVIGHVITDTGSTTAVTGNVTVVQGTATNLKAQAESYQGGTAVGSGNPLQVTLANTGANATAVKVDGSAATQPVSGTVTVVQPTGTNLHAVIDSGTLTAVTAITNPLPAGSNVIGHVITDSGSTTAVTGTVTIAGAVTEASLDAALIAQETTTAGIKGLTVFGAVTTAAPTYTTAKTDALSLQTNGSLRTAVTDALPAGANVIGHVIVDTTSTTAVTQATASSLNAQVVGNIASDGVDSGNPIKTGYKAATAAPSPVSAADRVDALGDVWGRAYVRHGIQAPVASTFTAVHLPATNVQGTATKASAGSGKRNVCTGFTVTLTAGASAITAAAPISVAVIDGASGGTTYLWRSYLTIPATAGAIASINRSGLWLVGSQATALTVEFSAAGGTNSYESIAFDGVIVEE